MSAATGTIGVFDSGIGGLSVLSSIAQALPRANLIYLADTAHLPYGDKDDRFIRGRVLSIGRELVDQGCTMLVVACNTATAAAVAALRASFPEIPVVGVEPGVKPAASASKSGRIVVLTTSSTARSERLARLIAHYAATVTIDVLPCPGWATRVETLQLDDPGFAQSARLHLAPALDAGADRVVLGCTHYTFLAPVLEPIVSGRALLVDVADAVARQCLRLAGEGLRSPAGECWPSPAGESLRSLRLPASSNSRGEYGRLTLLATADPERLTAALAALGLDLLAARQNAPARRVAV
jgi:glutamate racemase